MHSLTHTFMVSLPVSTVTAASGFCYWCCGCFRSCLCSGNCSPSPIRSSQSQDTATSETVLCPKGHDVCDVKLQDPACSAISFSRRWFVLTGAKVLCNICASSCRARCTQVCEQGATNPGQRMQSVTSARGTINNSFPIANLKEEVHSYWRELL